MSNQTSPVPISWQSELNATAFKYHVLVAWIAVIVDPVWIIGDYFATPEHFTSFAVLRLSASALTLIGILFKNRFVKHPEIIALIPFISITIQNAYMYSVLDIAEFQKHTLAYITLFIGGGMFVLWKPIYSVLVVLVSFISSIIFFWLNSPLNLSEILVNGGLLTSTVALFSILLIYTRTNLTKKEIIARFALAESNGLLEIKNAIIEEKNKDITDSIRYAKRIQYTLLAHQEILQQNIPNHFILFQPKDIVSGDFYWATKKESRFYLAICDSTGHGVPGAFMSLLNISFLNEAINEKNILAPNEILNYVRNRLISSVSQDGAQDGMDGILLCITASLNKDERISLEYAAANNAPVMVKGGELIELLADKMPIGKGENNSSFTLQKIDSQKGDTIYFYTDGYADQFGGPKGKKFKYKQLNSLLLDKYEKPMNEQKNILEQKINEWKGNLEQVDDILVIGIRL